VRRGSTGAWVCDFKPPATAALAAWAGVGGAAGAGLLGRLVPLPRIRAAIFSSTLEEAAFTSMPAARSAARTSLVGTPRSLAIS
jgi:hypothetical protein